MIYTADNTQSIVNANQGVDIFTGDFASAKTYLSEQTRLLDLEGKMVIPGLHDAHIHLAGIVETDGCDSSEDLYPR